MNVDASSISAPPGWNPGQVTDAGQEGEHEVELLLNRRLVRGVTRYLVRWRGHTSADDEWLRAADEGRPRQYLRRGREPEPGRWPEGCRSRGSRLGCRRHRRGIRPACGVAAGCSGIVFRHLLLDEGAPIGRPGRARPRRAASAPPPSRGRMCVRSAPRARTRRPGCGQPRCRGPSPPLASLSGRAP